MWATIKTFLSISILDKLLVTLTDAKRLIQARFCDPFPIKSSFISDAFHFKTPYSRPEINIGIKSYLITNLDKPEKSESVNNGF